jgi:hypothetical protein
MMVVASAPRQAQRANRAGLKGVKVFLLQRGCRVTVSM